ncbi:PucR-like helix-turn-helix protein [Kribbella orskensis]|uniref:PucR-like helix-turn-helix protein n=1 Tax=Kribbella orskensis TaxID=2512216 RepID=A0ABY2BMX5_9ACTN|nr:MULTISPECIES: helix-turn-helix domain-containing protein [Kribbella]TCN41720.1 PucR-like helix-turn-helix protein [Kribbella sp. VKM Ac-2500]TCO25598.1 PucR-like helix-turn-helix protein [Kribbella orskensis]
MGTEAAQGRARLEVALDSRLPELLAEVRDLLADGMPEYAAFLDHNPRGMREAAELFIHRLLDMAEHGRSVSRDDHLEGAQTIQLVFEQIGRRQWQAGEDLTRLLTAYQLGARTAWRHVSDTALALEVRPDVLAALAEAVFDFINQLSSASARGYVLEQREDASARERSREELAELLLSDRSSMNAIREAAARANWPLPETGAVVLVDATTDVARRVLSHVDAGSLPVRHEQLSGAIVPDPGPSSRRDQLRRALRGTNAVVGHTVPLEYLPRSVAIAQIAVRLKQQGILADDPVFVDEHLDTIIVHRDERLVGFLRDQLLAPLDDLPAGARARLIETLSAWLRHMGDRTAIAEELHIHPQTVRYRVAQLRERFGDQLDSPRSRARLFLALVWPVR